MIAGYRKVRRADTAEVEALPILARGAALRFMLTRLVDWLNVPPARWCAERPARISRQAALSPARRSGRATTGCVVSRRRDLDRRACSGNPGPGGWGAILRYGEREKELTAASRDHQQSHAV